MSFRVLTLYRLGADFGMGSLMISSIIKDFDLVGWPTESFCQFPLAFTFLRGLNGSLP
jgi:hypothetical protein